MSPVVTCLVLWEILVLIGKAPSYGRYREGSTVQGFIATYVFTMRVCGDTEVSLPAVPLPVCL